jgi:hypothetical protein
MSTTPTLDIDYGQGGASVLSQVGDAVSSNWGYAAAIIGLGVGIKFVRRILKG